jgi:hypothetical protein
MYMFYEILLCSWTKGFYKREGKKKRKGGGHRDRNLKKDSRGISLRVFGLCILLYLQLYLIYYGSRCGRRQVAEPPKIMC